MERKLYGFRLISIPRAAAIQALTFYFVRYLVWPGLSFDPRPITQRHTIVEHVMRGPWGALCI